MKKKILLILISIITIDAIIACTTFVIRDSRNLIFGRNFDWDISSAIIVVNKRGLYKQAIVQPPNVAAKWISKYGSITFNQIGIDSPMEGMNEKGLVIAQMELFESKYPDKIEKEVVGECEWIQYQLDNSANLAEVIENNKKVQIVPVGVPVHYMICDSAGNIGIVEYLNGELVITQGESITIPVCSNMYYNASKEAMKTYELYGGTKPLPMHGGSVPDIVAITNTMINDYDTTENAIDYGFEILNTVGSTTRTQWSAVFDIHNKTITFKTLHNRDVRFLSFTDFDFNCDNTIPILNVHDSKSETKNRGKLKDQFRGLTSDSYFDYKKTLYDLYFSKLPRFPKIPDEVINMEVNYVMEMRICKR